MLEFHICLDNVMQMLLLRLHEETFRLDGCSLNRSSNSHPSRQRERAFRRVLRELEQEQCSRKRLLFGSNSELLSGVLSGHWGEGSAGWGVITVGLTQNDLVRAACRYEAQTPFEPGGSWRSELIVAVFGCSGS